MEHLGRTWQRSLVGKATLILIGLLLLVIVVGIPVGVIILLTDPSRHPAEAPPTTQAISSLQITTTATTLTASPSPTPTVVPLPSPSLTPTTAVSMLVQLTITDTNDFVNIRSGPGLTYTVVSRLNKGQTATVIGRNADFSWVADRYQRHTWLGLWSTRHPDGRPQQRPCVAGDQPAKLVWGTPVQDYPNEGKE